jgi:hypothetical protein
MTPAGKKVKLEGALEQFNIVADFSHSVNYRLVMLGD